MKSLEDIIMETLVQSGLSKDDEATQQLSGSLANLFVAHSEQVELVCRINEVEAALKQTNKMLYGKHIKDDIGDRYLIDPKILRLRLQGLKKMQQGKK